MNPACAAPLSDDDLLDYWIHAIADTEVERIESHLFACASCASRLESMASLGAGLSALVRRGRISGILSRSLLNRIQRDGVHVRTFTLTPGERVPCAAFPDDELLVVSMRADLTGSDAVTLAVTGPNDVELGRVSDVPVGPDDVEILWVTTGDSIRRMPSTRLRLTLSSDTRAATVLGEYQLDHTELPPSSDRDLPNQRV